MHNEIFLEEVIQGVLQYQEDLGYNSTYIRQNKRYYDQLLKLNNSHGEVYLTDVVIDEFLNDCLSTQTLQFSKTIFDGHRRCIRWIAQFIKEENTLIKPYSKPIQSNIAEGFYAFATLKILADAMKTVEPDVGTKAWHDNDTLKKLYKL